MRHPRWAAQPPRRNGLWSNLGTAPGVRPLPPTPPLHARILTSVRSQGGTRLGPGAVGPATASGTICPIPCVSGAGDSPVYRWGCGEGVEASGLAQGGGRGLDESLQAPTLILLVSWSTGFREPQQPRSLLRLLGKQVPECPASRRPTAPHGSAQIGGGLGPPGAGLT